MGIKFQQAEVQAPISFDVDRLQVIYISTSAGHMWWFMAPEYAMFAEHLPLTLSLGGFPSGGHTEEMASHYAISRPFRVIWAFWRLALTASVTVFGKDKVPLHTRRMRILEPG